MCRKFGGEVGAGSGSRTPASAGGRGSPAPAVPCFRSPLKDSVTYIDAEKCVEFETPDGQWHKLDIYQVRLRIFVIFITEVFLIL